MMLKCFLCGITASIALGCYTPAIAQTNTNSDQRNAIDPYLLCEDWPLNSACQPHHLNPVALEDRPGAVALGCALTVDNTELQGRCKYTIESDKVIAYIEEGPELASLNDQQPTRIVDIPISDIAKLFYEEDTAENRRSLLEFLPLIRVARQIFRQPKEISLISVVFLSSADTERSTTIESDPVSTPDETTAGETTVNEQQLSPIILTLVVNREQGGEVRSQFETSTGLPSEAPPSER